MFRYVPGASAPGFAVLSERVVVLLSDRDGGAALALEVHGVLDGGEGFDAALDLLDRDDRGSGAVAAVEVTDARRRTVRTAVRGDAGIELVGGESTRLGGSGRSGWITSEARGIRGFLLELPGSVHDADGVELPLRGGIVACSRIVFEARVRKGATPAASEPATEPATEPARPAATAAPAASGWVFGLPDGSELDAALPSVIGRRPWERRSDRDSRVHVVVPSPRHEISGEHLALGFDGEGPTARDLGSTNGTLLLSGGRPPRLLRDGAVARLAEGDILDLGEGCCVSVVARSAVGVGIDAPVTNG